MTGRRPLVIAVVAAIGVILLFFVFVLKPVFAEIEQTKTEIQTAQEEEQTLRSRVARLLELRRDAPVIAARLAKVTQLLPSTPDLPGFIRVVQDAATRAGVNLQAIAPSTPAEMDGATGVQTISVGLTVQASFRRMQDFLSRLESLRRIVLVQSLSLTPTVDELSGQRVLQTTLPLMMFVVQPNASVGGSTSQSAPAASPAPSP